MQPKLELKDKIEVIFDVRQSIATTKRASILVGLQQSKGLYELQINHAKDENLRLKRNLEQIQFKLFEVSESCDQ